MRLPDQLGASSNKAIITALGMDDASVASVHIDFNANTVEIEVYVLDKGGRPIVKQDGTPAKTWLEYPVHARLQ